VVRVFEPEEPTSYLSVGVEAYIPTSEDIAPRVGVEGFSGAQPYKIAFFGEKASLEDVLGPLADRYHADLYLPTGEISDPHVHQMASVAVADGRPMVVFCFSDCDPAGHQMPISIARKLQAFKAFKFPELEFELHRVALTPDHVREHALPSTPLKTTEKRAQRWVEAMGVEQTEIDALATLRPGLLREIAEDAIAPYFDHTLDSRVLEAQSEWLNQAQAAVDSSFDQEQLERLRTRASERLREMSQEIDALNESLRMDTEEIDLPPLQVPTARLGGDGPEPLVDSSWSFAEQCRRLIDSKKYQT
jgi:hypothetical protein